jgi:hypothetical protein
MPLRFHLLPEHGGGDHFGPVADRSSCVPAAVTLVVGQLLIIAAIAVVKAMDLPADWMVVLVAVAAGAGAVRATRRASSALGWALFDGVGVNRYGELTFSGSDDAVPRSPPRWAVPRRAAQPAQARARSNREPDIPARSLSLGEVNAAALSREAAGQGVEWRNGTRVDRLLAKGS